MAIRWDIQNMGNEAAGKTDWEARDEWEPQFEQAILLRTSGDLVEAEQIARRVLALRPRLNAVRGFLGELMMEIGNFEMAAHEFMTVTREAPQSKQASLGLFRALSMMGDTQSALAEAERFLAHCEDPEYRKGYGRLLLGTVVRWSDPVDDGV